MLAATFDIGTTAVKAVVVNENGEAVFTGSSVIHTIETENFKEQDPDEWYEAFCGLSKELFEVITGFFNSTPASVTFVFMPVPPF